MPQTGGFMNELTLEDLAKSRGQTRYYKLQERVETDLGFNETDGARSLIQANLKALGEQISLRLNSQPFADHLRNLGPLKVALVTLTYTFNSIPQVRSVAYLMEAIGRHVEAECWAQGYLERDEKKARLVERKVKRKHGSMKYRRQSARSLAARGGYQVDGWTKALRIKLGEWLVNVLLEVCQNVFCVCYVETTGRRAGKEYTQEVAVVVLTEWAREHIEEVSRAMAEAAPMLLPMVERPDDWKGIVGGGYKDQVLKRLYPLIRIKYGNQEHKALLNHAVRSGQMQPVLEAVNSIQSVPFKINTRILILLNWVRDRKVDVEGLPPFTDYDPPEYPKNWEELSEDDKRKWKKKGANIALKNLGLVGARKVFHSDLETAEMLASAGCFYVPHCLDFRGRIYGLSHFNFQRGDHVRSLFLFAEGKPIGDQGLYWLAIHLANCGDFGKVSKRSFADRLHWVNENLERILDVASDPYGTVSWWKEADSPFLFVAACMEYAEALVHGPTYVSHLPVSWDGSCSGLQHLTAMMHSEEGTFVNLTPTPEPQDIYQAVADRVVERLKQDMANGNIYAQTWLSYGFTRKEAKRGVMTYAYSSRAFGMADQLREDLMVPLADQVLRGALPKHPFGDNEGFAEASYMGKLLCDTIEGFVKAPAQAMGFLRKIALALAHEGKSATWVTPLGLPVVSWYPEIEQDRVILYLFDRGYRNPYHVRLDDGPRKTVKKEKSANGIAPNFVHAYDAAHLMLTVNAAVAEGITQHALVHDSFGCLAADAGRYNEIIREQFVKLYTDHDVLADIRNETLKQISVANAHRVPEVPTKGSLDLTEVLRSDYAFA